MEFPAYTSIGAIVLAFVAAAVTVRIAHALVHRFLDALQIVSAENRSGVNDTVRVSCAARLTDCVSSIVSASRSLWRSPSLARPRGGTIVTRSEPRCIRSESLLTSTLIVNADRLRSAAVR